MSIPFDRRFRFRPLALGALLALSAGAAGCLPATSPPAADTPASEVPAAENSAAENSAAVPGGMAPAAAEPRRAQVGVGRQGRSLDDETGVGRMLAQPAVTLFAVRERVVFEIQIPQALQLFEAIEGRKPKSHEEFMQRIVSDNQIPLPELPAGSEYRYDPGKGELWVHPQK